MIIDVSQQGEGPFFRFTDSDLFAWVARDTVLLQTKPNSSAILMGAPNANSAQRQHLIVSGEIYSVGRGALATQDAIIDVAAGGSITASRQEFSVANAVEARGYEGDPNYLTLSNHGVIESLGYWAVYIGEPGATADHVTSRITNFGLIAGAETNGGGALWLGRYDDSVINLGRIVGRVVLGGGNDLFDTRSGEVIGAIEGGAGDDSYILAGGETILESANGGMDRVQSFGDFVLPANIELLTLLGDARVGIGNALANEIAATGFGGELRGLGGNDRLLGGVGDDLLRGEAGDDRLTGAGGYDRLYGGGGNDLLELAGEEGGEAYGQKGDDALVGSAGIDVLNGGEGNDRVEYSNSTQGVSIDLLTGRGFGGDAEGDRFTSIEGASGSPLDDTLSGSAAVNRLLGANGADKLYGLGGNDTLEGGAGADLLDGGAGNDTASYAGSSDGVHVELGVIVELADAQGDALVSIENLIGSGFADKLAGSQAANRLTGLGGDDYLLGGDGNDVIDGGIGRDDLHGGNGRDTFVFADLVPGTQGGWGLDIVDDFADGVDRIDLRGVSGVHSIADLTITQGPSGALITIGADNFELWFITPAQVDPSDFLFG